MRIYSYVITLFLVSTFCLGCAGVDIPKTAELIKEPLGKGSVKVGMTKDQVVSVYGEADITRSVSSDEWKGEREEWFYRGRYSALPINAGYLSSDLYLYFDGENLTNISDRPLGKKTTSSKFEKNSDSFIK